MKKLLALFLSCSLTTLLLGEQSLDQTSLNKSEISNEEVIETEVAVTSDVPETEEVVKGVVSTIDATKTEENDLVTIRPNNTVSLNKQVLATILSLTVLLIFSLFLIFLLLRWRKAKPGNLIELAPEELMRDWNEIKRQFTTLSKQLGLVLEHNKNQSDDVKDSLNSIFESFSTLQDSLSSKDKEIERLRKGYDAEIFKSFLLRFIRAKQAADDIKNESDTSPETKEAITEVKELIEDALDECGVVPYTLSKGQHIQDENLFGVPKRYRTVATSDESLHLTIADVHEDGLCLDGGELKQIVLEAEISVFIKE